MRAAYSYAEECRNSMVRMPKITKPAMRAKPGKKEKLVSSALSQFSLERLKGWQEISRFLGQPVSVAERWASDGMPVRKQGRFITATPVELNAWLQRQAGGEPLHVASKQEDLSTELKRGLAYVRKRGEAKRKS
jgi:hypothetical protein